MNGERLSGATRGRESTKSAPINRGSQRGFHGGHGTVGRPVTQIALFLVLGSLSRLNRGKREAKTSHIYSRVLPEL